MKLQTLWVKKGSDAKINELDGFKKLNEMLADGWELVAWQPFCAQGMTGAVNIHPLMYDIYLLKHH